MIRADTTDKIELAREDTIAEHALEGRVQQEASEEMMIEDKAVNMLMPTKRKETRFRANKK